MRKQLILSLFILFLIISLSAFISAALCKGPSGYYDDCFKLIYGYYPNYYNYPDYTFYQEKRYNYDFYPKKKIIYGNDNSYNLERSYYPYNTARKHYANNYRNNRFYVGPYARDESGNYHLVDY